MKIINGYKSPEKQSKEYKSNKKKADREILKLQRKINRLRRMVNFAYKHGVDIDLPGILSEIKECEENISRLQGEILAINKNIELNETMGSAYEKLNMDAINGLSDEEYNAKKAILDLLSDKMKKDAEDKIKIEEENYKKSSEVRKKVVEASKNNVDTVEFNPNRNKPEQKTEQNPGTKPGQNPGTKPGQNPGTKPGQNPGTKPGQNPGTKPGQNPGTKPGQNPGTKPGQNPGTKPEQKPQQKHEQKSGEKIEPNIELLKNIDFSKLGIEGINSYEDLLNLDISDMNTIFKILEKMELKEPEMDIEKEVQSEMPIEEEMQPEMPIEEEVQPEMQITKGELVLENLRESVRNGDITLNDLRKVTKELQKSQNKAKAQQKRRDEIEVTDI